MSRDSIGDSKYWNDRVEAEMNFIKKSCELIKTPAANPAYEPQYLFDLAKKYMRLMLLKYSRGDGFEDFSEYCSCVIKYWERSDEESLRLCENKNIERCRDWDFSLSNLNHYNWCFRLVGLALIFEVSDSDWIKLINLISKGGEDVLLDRIIASRDKKRPIGKTLLHEKPYSRLLKCIDANQDDQPLLLREFLESWYKDLKRTSPKARNSPPIEPYWYVYGDPQKNPLSMGSYFGRWCIEAAVAAKVFDVSDSLCLGHEHYPGELIHTFEHPEKKTCGVSRKNWLSKLLAKIS